MRGNSTGQAQASAGHRRFGGLLWQRNFRLLWIGETVSQVGNAMAVVGVPLVAVLVLHASTFAVGLLTAAAWLPWLVIGLPAGAWVDRLPARRVMIACDVISAGLYASVPIAAWAGVLTMGLVVAVQLLAGAASVVFMTAYQVYLPSLAQGLLLVAGDPFLWPLSVFWAIANLALTGYAALLVVFLVRVIGPSAASAGLLTAAPGVGGILGALLAGRVTTRYGTARGLLVSTCCTWLGPRNALWVMLGIVALSGTVLLTCSSDAETCQPRRPAPDLPP